MIFLRGKKKKETKRKEVEKKRNQIDPAAPSHNHHQKTYEQ